MATQKARARIRSIKPEFWTDDKIAELPKATALFFIALWSFATDQGVIEDGATALHLRIPIFRSQDIEKMLNALWQKGLIARSRVDGLVFIRGWKHQKIDKPTAGKWNPNEIAWFMSDGSPMPCEESATGGDQIGGDRKGGECGEMANPPPPSPSASEDSEAERARAFSRSLDLADLFEFYAERMKKRRLCDVVVRLPDQEALERVYDELKGDVSKIKKLLTTYVNADDDWFVKRGWSLQVFESDLPKISARVAA